MNSLTIVRITDDAGAVIEPTLLRQALPLHQQLRPHLPTSAEEYAAKMERVFSHGARLVAAQRPDGSLAGLALYRVYENTYEDLRLYIDDLVTDESQRSQGVGSALIDWCEQLARQRGCRFMALDSGTWRTAAHKLYFRKGFSISSFHFTRPLESDGK